MFVTLTVKRHASFLVAGTDLVDTILALRGMDCTGGEKRQYMFGDVRRSDETV